MRLKTFLLGLGLAIGVHAEEPGDPPPQEIEPPTASSALPPDTSLERHFPAEQQRRLGEAESSFLTLWLPAARPEPRGAVLLVGDHGEHADWPDLIGPARRQLSEAGWNTLSMALPTELPMAFGLPDEALAERSRTRQAELAARLQLALNSLAEAAEAELPTIVVARGQAAYQALALDAEALGIDALVVFRPRAPMGQERGLADRVAAWEKPLLELIPVADGTRLDHQERASTARRLERAGYQQWHVADLRAAPEAQSIMIRRLQGWLERVGTD